VSISSTSWGLRKVCLSLALFLFGLVVQGQVTFYNADSIQEIRISFATANWRPVLDSLFVNYGEAARMDATVTINGKVFLHAGVRYKGFSSYDDDQKKNPFNIDLDYAYPDANYQGFAKLKLSNVIHDPSFIREVLSYDIARNYMPASRANFAKVFVNDTLIGLYTNVEAVDKKFIAKHFSDNSNTFFKGSPATLEYPFGQNANLAFTHGTDSNDYMPYYKMESETGWSDLYNFIYTLNNDTALLAEILNIDRTLWMHAFNYSLVNLDSYIGYAQNYYMYKDQNGRFNPILWDLNMSFGSFRNTDATQLSLSIAKVKQLNPLQHLYSVSYSPRPLMKNLFANSSYRKMYLAHLRTIIDEQFRTGSYMTRAQELQNIIAGAVTEDTNKFYSVTDFVNNLTVTTGPSSDQYPGIQDLMEARIAYLDTLPGFNGAPVYSMQKISPARPVSGQTCRIYCSLSGAQQVMLNYRSSSNGLFISVPMSDDGTGADSLAGDQTFSAEIVASGDILQYYFWSENDSAGRFLPERAQYVFFTVYPYPAGKLVINEILAQPAKDAAVQLPWLEVFNASREAINLKDISLYSANDAALPMFVFPDTLMAPSAFLTVFMDGTGSIDGLHSSIILPDTGGILMKRPDGGQIAALYYGYQTEGRSFGSYPNASANTAWLKPSFGTSNVMAVLTTSPLSIFPNPASDILYIQNTGTEKVKNVALYNSQMQQVLSMDMPFGNNDQPSSLLLNVASFNAGLYFVESQTESASQIIKVIITK
jgi:hypothetical protein